MRALPTTFSSFNRREWLKTTGAVLAGLAVAPHVRLSAQHEADRSAGRREPAKLSSNENPFGPSQSASMAMISAMEKACRYPAPETAELMKLIAAKEGCSPDNIVLGVGSGEILDIVGMHYGLQKGEIVCAQPGYLQLIRAAEAAGGKAVWVPLNKKLEHDLPAMAARVNEKTSVVYVCNPNNPTGTVVDAAQLKDFVKEVSKKTLVFVDEAYLDCADDYAGRTVVGLVNEGHNVVVARTFSKIHGMAGLRVGYGIMPAKLAAEIKSLGTGSLNMMGVVAATASIQDTDFIAETRGKIKAGRDGLIALCKSMGKEYAEPQGNFVFMKTGMLIKDFQEKMKAENVLVARPFPPLLEWARISIGTPEEMAACHAALKKVLGA